MVKAASIQRRHRARNEGRRPPPAQRAACPELERMLTRAAAMLRPSYGMPAGSQELALRRKDLDARVARHKTTCPTCRAPSGPLDAF